MERDVPPPVVALHPLGSHTHVTATIRCDASGLLRMYTSEMQTEGVCVDVRLIECQRAVDGVVEFELPQVPRSFFEPS